MDANACRSGSDRGTFDQIFVLLLQPWTILCSPRRVATPSPQPLRVNATPNICQHLLHLLHPLRQGIAKGIRILPGWKPSLVLVKVVVRATAGNRLPSLHPSSSSSRTSSLLRILKIARKTHHSTLAPSHSSAEQDLGPLLLPAAG